MMDKHRYEIKFVVNDIKLAEFYAWLWTRTAMHEAYPERIINSLYFDDVKFRSVRDNIAGLPAREKFRMRWYSFPGNKNNLEVQGIKLEKKVREGRLGYKESISLAHLKDQLLSRDIGYLKSSSMEQFVKLGLIESNLGYEIFPALHVNYKRKYFEDMDNIRITIDSDINFYHVSDLARLFEHSPLGWSKKVIEFKFDPVHKNKVAELIRPLHMVPQRCSKYLQGMAYNNMVMYL